MKSIEEYFIQPAPETLFHYTGVGPLLKIVETRKIFASHAYYLNDSREVSHAASLLQLALRGYQGTDFEESQFLSQFQTWLKTMHQTPYGVFVFSLSENGSLLSQWRSYTPHGKGVSLGFSASFLNALLAKNELRLAKCIYSLDQQQELVLALVEKMLVSFRRDRETMDLAREHYETRYFKFLESFRGNLLQVFSIMKHPSFEEEAEWRLISRYYPSFVGPHMKFREGASMLMPYVEISFPDDWPGEIFEKVILGPSQSPNLSMRALGSFLSNSAACRVVVNSDIPFRKW